jgi:hypothetical protein
VKQVSIPDHARSWDTYKAFHAACSYSELRPTSSYGNTPLILFDTGELICTYVNHNARGSYHSVGVTLGLATDRQIYLPDGTLCAKAWLDDGGQQQVLVDEETGHVVSVDARRSAPHNYQGKETPGSPITPGIPLRFQYNSTAYIPGPGLPPIGHEPITVKRPLAKAGYTKDEIEHIQMIVHTGQAAMKLTDHSALNQRHVGTRGADPDVLLACKTWQDVPQSMLPELGINGCARRSQKWGYLLTREPK